MNQELWAVDLDLCYGDTVAMSRLFEFATNGKFDPITHSFTVSPPQPVEKKRRSRINAEPEVKDKMYYILCRHCYSDGFTNSTLFCVFDIPTLSYYSLG
jgi:hypothetical protein